MQPQPEKKKPKLTQATKINKALKDAPAIIVGNVGDDDNPASENDNSTMPPAPPIAD